MSATFGDASCGNGKEKASSVPLFRLCFFCVGTVITAVTGVVAVLVMVAADGVVLSM
jgi:hypothetical protein